MENLFLRTVNSSITASIIILFILALRFLFRKSTKKFSYMLWLILLVKLIIPISFETTLNPMPDNFMEFSNKAYIEEIGNKEIAKDLDINTVEKTNLNNVDEKTFAKAKGNITKKNKLNIKSLIPHIWIIGMAISLLYGIVSNQKLKENLKNSIHLYDNIHENKDLETAFIHGIINPKIYIPDYLDEKEREYIIIHEQTHLKRYDHIVKFLYYIILSIHWFNPLIWLSFILMGRDMELSCDEIVMKKLGNEAKGDYCKTLLSLATGHRINIVEPLSFSENNTKGRVRNVLDYKKPKFWVSLILIIVVTISTFFIFTKPRINEKDAISRVEDDEYEIYNKTFKNPKDVAEIIFKKELEKVKEYTYKDVKIEEMRITNFESKYTYEDYLGSDIEVFEFEYIIKGKELLDYPFVDITADGILTEESLGTGRPLLAFLNKDGEFEFLGFIFYGELFSNSKAEIEIGLIELLENRGLKSPETFTGNHILAEYKLRGGGTYKILLSQAAKIGEGGIWCIDRWMDNNGNVYYPIIESNLSLKEYYGEIQEEVDKGENSQLLNWENVAINFVKENLGYNFAKAYSFSFYENASIDDFLIKPINEYYGYIMEIKKYDWSEDDFIHFDKVEFLKEENSIDIERLKELDVDPNKLDNGYHIYNPTSYPDTFVIDENTEFYIIKESEAKSIKVDKDRFIEHSNKNKNALYMLEDENFKLKKVMQVYLP